MGNDCELPRVDEHAMTIDAGCSDVWRALLDVVDDAFGGTWAGVYARLVGCPERAATGPRPFVEGSTIPGFRVVRVRSGTELVLGGRHRFSTYALTFRIDEVGPERTRVRAETRATFPGARGVMYRLLVIGTRGHAVAVRRLLAAVSRRACASVEGATS